MASSASFSAERPTGLGRWLTPVLVLGAAVLIGHAPLAWLHLKSLWQQEQYQYFPFVILAVGYLLWDRWQQADRRPPVARRWASLPLWIAVAALGLLVGSILVVSPWLAFVSLNVGLAAVLMLLNRQRAIAYVWGIWLLLWLLVPLPLGVDGRLVSYLQRLSSRLSSTILDLLGILHLMSGNVLQLPTKEFFVDEACSGIVSVMSMIACAAIYAVWNNRSAAHFVALVLAGVAWALVLNVLRISLIAVAYHYYDFDLSTGAIHDALGLSLFLLMFLALVSTDSLLIVMLAPIKTEHLDEAGQNNLLVRLWNGAGKSASETATNAAVASDDAERATDQESPASSDTAAGDRSHASISMPAALTWALLFLSLGIVQLVWLPSSDTAEAAQAIQRALALEEDSLPAKIGPWKLESFETIEREAYSDFGKYSKNYRYRHAAKPGITATVSLDFPYLGGWHDLCMCYRNTGWTINDRVIETADDSQASDDWPFVAGDLEDSAKGKASLAFAGFDATGELAEPPGDAVLFRPWFRLRRRLLLNIAPQLFQVQVFGPFNSADDLELKQQLQQLMQEARLIFRDQVAVTP